ncbi:MAG: 4Fe-4S dicluster domain-containing protein [Bacteroidetes bacterium]|nr:MAG: 4Fe-4S dicluster domain-containing protein [Bacteroidota bacterium]
MSVTNNAMIIRRDLLTRIIKLMEREELEKKIDRIPLEVRPRGEDSVRCCVHKDRAVLKYKLMAILGFNIADETDELTPLSEYVRMAYNGRSQSDVVLTVVDEACSSCRQTSYEVSNLCRGCVARPCINNCPKDAIRFFNGQAHIDHKACVNCGKCLKMCPFHAIVYMPVPCEEVCPVNAIKKNDRGVEYIDPAKCINCGKCMIACPFGAIMEKSNLVDIFRNKIEGKKLIALLAPAIAGQFGSDIQRIRSSFHMLGFDYVYEVAEGAEQTIFNEAAELKERLEEGQPFMTTSCCPGYTSLVDKHIPALKPFVSHTRSPMHYMAKKAREEHHDACIVFVSPCPAKKWEVYHDSYTDYTLSFEEYGAWLVARQLDLNDIEPLEGGYTPAAEARGFATSGGVTAAVKKVAEGVNINETIINGIDKAALRQLKNMPRNYQGNFVEVMTCENGCIGGCNVISNPRLAAKKIQEAMDNAPGILAEKILP